MKKFFRNNGLSIVLAGLFLIFWACQAVAGWKVNNNAIALAGGPTLDFPRYLLSGHFWGATGENWESEFLQMGFYVLLTCFLYQKGSAESKDPDDTEDGKPKQRKLEGGLIFRNSLSIAFTLLFGLSFAIHAGGGLAEENLERAANHLPAERMGEFVTGPEFWFQSFQNWQSEFLAVFSIVVLTIFLRQKGSPQSKEVGDSNSKTG